MVVSLSGVFGQSALLTVDKERWKDTGPAQHQNHDVVAHHVIQRHCQRKLKNVKGPALVSVNQSW